MATCADCKFWNPTYYLKDQGYCRRITTAADDVASLDNDFDGANLVTAPTFGCNLHEVGVPKREEEPPPSPYNSFFQLDFPTSPLPELRRLDAGDYKMTSGKTITFRRLASLSEEKKE